MKAPLVASAGAFLPVLVTCGWLAGPPGAGLACLGLVSAWVFFVTGVPIERAGLGRADSNGLALVLGGYAVRLGILAVLLWALATWNDGYLPAGGVAAAVVAPTLGWVAGLAWGAWHTRQFVYDQPVVPTVDEEDEGR